MTEVTLDIKQWGNNLGVRLPAAIARDAKIHVHQRVSITVVGKQIIITPVQGEKLSLDQRLENFDPVLHADEAMSTEHKLGSELW